LPPRIITERHKSLCKRIIVCLLPSFSLSLLLALFHPVAYFTGVPDQAHSRTSSQTLVSWALIQSQILKAAHILNCRMVSLSLSVLISLSLFHSLSFFYIIFPSHTYCLRLYPYSFPLSPVFYTLVCRTNVM